MKNFKRILSSLAITALSISMVTGCGPKFDASKYLQGTLDNSYKNDSALAIEQTNATEEQAKQLYEEGIDAMVTSMLGGTGTDETKATYKELMMTLFAKADYTVGEAEKLSDGSFKVSVECKKMKVFGPAFEATKAEILEKNDPSVGLEETYVILAEKIQEQLDAGCEFGDPETVTVTISLSGKEYVPSTADLTTLQAALYDYEALQ